LLVVSCQLLVVRNTAFAFFASSFAPFAASRSLLLGCGRFARGVCIRVIRSPALLPPRTAGRFWSLPLFYEFCRKPISMQSETQILLGEACLPATLCTRDQKERRNPPVIFLDFPVEGSGIQYREKGRFFIFRLSRSFALACRVHEAGKNPAQPAHPSFPAPAGGFSTIFGGWLFNGKPAQPGRTAAGRAPPR